MDWSSKGIHITYNGEDVERLESTESLLDELRSPHCIVTESTFESWDPQRRRKLVQQIREEGHEILVYRPIHTARQRPSDWEKSDENDVRVIFQISKQGTLNLYPLPEPDPKWVTLFEKANREYINLRASGDKAALVETAETILGPYKKLPKDKQQALGNGSKYMPSVLAAAYHASQYASDRHTFQRLLGLHGSGHPSILRSEIHHHGYRHLQKRGVTWAEYRRALRWAYQQFKAAQKAARDAA